MKKVYDVKENKDLKGVATICYKDNGNKKEKNVSIKDIKGFTDRYFEDHLNVVVNMVDGKEFDFPICDGFGVWTYYNMLDCVNVTDQKVNRDFESFGDLAKTGNYLLTQMTRKKVVK